MTQDPYRIDREPNRDHVDYVRSILPYAQCEYSNRYQCYMITSHTASQIKWYDGPSARSRAEAWELAALELV